MTGFLNINLKRAALRPGALVLLGQAEFAVALSTVNFALGSSGQESNTSNGLCALGYPPVET